MLRSQGITPPSEGFLTGLDPPNSPTKPEPEVASPPGNVDLIVIKCGYKDIGRNKKIIIRRLKELNIDYNKLNNNKRKSYKQKL